MNRKNFILILLILVTGSILQAQTTLYARNNGNWNNGHPTNGTWSLNGPSGASCNCVPTTNSTVIIDGYSVSLSGSGNVKDLTIASTSSLTISNSSTLSIHGNGNVLLLSGGTLAHSGATSNARFQIMQGNHIINVQSGFNFNLDDIIIEDNVQLTINGNGDLNLTNDFRFEGNSSSIVNNSLGRVIVGRDISYAPGFSENTFLNNGKLNVLDDISLNGFKNTLVNNDSLNLSDDISFLGNFCKLENTFSGILLCDDDISFSATTDCKVINTGSMLVRGQGLGGIVYEGLRDSIINRGVMTSLQDIKVQASQYDGNVYINDPSALLNVNGEFDLNNADFLFDNYGTFNLFGRFDEMGGNEFIYNRSGATFNYYGSHIAVLNNEIALFTDFNANEFNYSGTSNQDIIVPQDAYWNLKVSGSNTKELQGNLTINGNLEITGNVFLSVSGANYDLNIHGNWTNNGNFFEGNSTIIFDGSIDQNIFNNTGETFHNITVNKSSGNLILQTDVLVSNVLNLTAGACRLNSNNMTIASASNSSITRTAGYIISEETDHSSTLTRNIGANTANYEFPFGTSAGAFIPFRVQSLGGDFGLVTVSTYATGANNLPWPTTPDLVTNLNSTIGASPDNRDNTIDRFWQIDKSGASGIANITFSYAQAEVSGNVIGNEGLLQGQRYNTSTNSWEAALPSQLTNPTNNTVTVNGVTSFSPWSLAISSAALPVTLLNFNAKLIGQEVELSWTTAAELNNDYFTLEKSKDAKNFFPFGSIPGAGTTSATHNYLGYDTEITSGLTYYRLKQTDFNGEFSYSEVIAINNKNSSAALNLYPNPTTSNNINVAVSQLHGSFELVVLDLSGKICFQKTFFLQEEMNRLKIQPYQPLSKGSYFVQLITNKGMQTTQLVIAN